MGSSKAVAEATDIVVTIVTADAEVREVILGPDGVLEGASEGKLIVDMSTISPLTIREVSKAATKKGVRVMDAPVSGGPEGARTGKLALMVGGDEETFKQCKPVLDAMGDKVGYTGKIGCGSICKLMHNCIGYGFISIIAECFTTGVKAGVEPKALWKARKAHEHKQDPSWLFYSLYGHPHTTFTVPDNE